MSQIIGVVVAAILGAALAAGSTVAVIELAGQQADDVSPVSEPSYGSR